MPRNATTIMDLLSWQVGSLLALVAAPMLNRVYVSYWRDWGFVARVDFDAGTRAYLSGATDLIIRCRLFGHAWDPTHDGYIVEGRGRDRVFTQTVKCLRCKSKGVDRFDPVTLDRIKSRSYEYAEGYLLQHPKGGMNRRLVRQWVAEQTSGRRQLRRVS